MHAERERLGSVRSNASAALLMRCTSHRWAVVGGQATRLAALLVPSDSWPRRRPVQQDMSGRAHCARTPTALPPRVCRAARRGRPRLRSFAGVFNPRYSRLELERLRDECLSKKLASEGREPETLERTRRGTRVLSASISSRLSPADGTTAAGAGGMPARSLRLPSCLHPHAVRRGQQSDGLRSAAGAWPGPLTTAQRREVHRRSEA